MSVRLSASGTSDGLRLRARPFAEAAGLLDVVRVVLIEAVALASGRAGDGSCWGTGRRIALKRGDAGARGTFPNSLRLLLNYYP